MHDLRGDGRAVSLQDRITPAPGLNSSPPNHTGRERREPLSEALSGRCLCVAGPGTALSRSGLGFPTRCTDAGCLYMHQGLIYVDLSRRGTNREVLLQVSGCHTLIPPN